MKNFHLNHLASTSVLILAAGLASCSDDNTNTEGPAAYTILNFSESQNIVAGPTAYGANCYANFTGERFTRAQFPVEEGVTLDFGLNTSSYYNAPDFSAGGIVLSNWNYRTDAPGMAQNWWKTYENQMSVYNVSSTSGSNMRAGVGGDDVFLVVYGTEVIDPAENNKVIVAAPSMAFSGGHEYVVESCYVCPTSYLYSAITEGSPYSSQPNVPLKEQKGWFKLLVYGFDAAGRPTNGGNPVEYTLADYREGNTVDTNLPVSWTGLSLKELGLVNKLKFCFDGSDKSKYAENGPEYLNTPTYICIDRMVINLIMMP